MHSLTGSGVLRDVGGLLVVGALPQQLTSAQVAEYVDAGTRLRDLVLARIHLEREHMEEARDQLRHDLQTLKESVGTKPKHIWPSCWPALRGFGQRGFRNAGIATDRQYRGADGARAGHQGYTWQRSMFASRPWPEVQERPPSCCSARGTLEAPSSTSFRGSRISQRMRSSWRCQRRSLWATGARNFHLRSREPWRTPRGGILGRRPSSSRMPLPRRPSALVRRGCRASGVAQPEAALRWQHVAGRQAPGHHPPPDGGHA